MAKFEVPESNDSPDLTPMIDVVFLLIVFFMVVAQAVSETYKEIDLGIASNAKIPENPPNRTIITVDEDPSLGQTIYWNENVIDMSQISVVVARNPTWKVLLRYQEGIPASILADVHDQVLIGGQSSIIFSAIKSEE